MAVSNEFQTRITDLVAESDHKRSDLPKLMGIDYSSLSNALNYGIIPTPRILIRIADFFNISLAYLLGSSDDETFFKAKEPTTFKDRVIALCDEKAVTCYRVSQDCFFDKSYISRWIHKGYFPSLELLEILSDYFDVSLDYICGRCEKPQGKLYEFKPKIENEEFKHFIEMCFDPSSPISNRLKESILQMYEEEKK